MIVLFLVGYFEALENGVCLRKKRRGFTKSACSKGANSLTARTSNYGPVAYKNYVNNRRSLF